jgi:hypothetical protein
MKVRKPQLCHVNTQSFVCVSYTLHAVQSKSLHLFQGTNMLGLYFGPKKKHIARMTIWSLLETPYTNIRNILTFYIKGEAHFDTRTSVFTQLHHCNSLPHSLENRFFAHNGLISTLFTSKSMTEFPILSYYTINYPSPKHFNPAPTTRNIRSI